MSAACHNGNCYSSPPALAAKNACPPIAPSVLASGQRQPKTDLPRSAADKLARHGTKDANKRYRSASYELQLQFHVGTRMMKRIRFLNAPLLSGLALLSSPVCAKQTFMFGRMFPDLREYQAPTVDIDQVDRALIALTCGKTASTITADCPWQKRVPTAYTPPVNGEASASDNLGPMFDQNIAAPTIPKSDDGDGGGNDDNSVYVLPPPEPCWTAQSCLAQILLKTFRLSSLTSGSSLITT